MSLSRDTAELKRLFEDLPVFKPATPDNIQKRTADLDKKIAIRTKAARDAEKAGVVKDAASEANFDDITTNDQLFEEDPDAPALWTQICEQHAEDFGINQMYLSEYPGKDGICGIVGCKANADYYYDFDTAETLPRDK